MTTSYDPTRDGRARARHVDRLTDRLTAEFPQVPEVSVHLVADAAWAEVADNPIREFLPELARRAATESLRRYPPVPRD